MKQFTVKVYDDSLSSDEHGPRSAVVTPALLMAWEGGKCTKTEVVATYAGQGFALCALYVNKTTGLVHIKSGSVGPALRGYHARSMLSAWDAEHSYTLAGAWDSRTELTPLSRTELVSRLSPYGEGPNYLLDADGCKFAERTLMRQVWDNHSTPPATRHHYVGMWYSPEWKEEFPVGVYLDTVFCLNHVYRNKETNRLRLSRCSIGPTLRGEHVKEAWEKGEALQVEMWGGKKGLLRQATQEDLDAVGHHSSPHTQREMV